MSAPPVSSTAPPDEDDRPLSPVIALLGVLLCSLSRRWRRRCAILIVPLRGHGADPVAVVLAAVTNIVLPLLVRRLVPIALVAAAAGLHLVRHGCVPGRPAARG